MRPPKIATAESITAGYISALLDHLSPESDAPRFVVYSNDAKHRLLDVDAELLSDKGAVCDEVARQMAVGAIEKSGADYAIAVTGFAGQSCDQERGIKCGTVFVAVACKKNDVIEVEIKQCNFKGNRTNDRTQTTQVAFEMLNKKLQENGHPTIDLPRQDLSLQSNQGNDDDLELIKRFGEMEVATAYQLLQECTKQGIKFSIVEKSTSGKIFNFFTSFNGSSAVFGAPGIIDKNFEDKQFSYLEGHPDINFVLCSDGDKLDLFSYSNQTVQPIQSFDLESQNIFKAAIDAVACGLACTKDNASTASTAINPNQEATEPLIRKYNSAAVADNSRS